MGITTSTTVQTVFDTQTGQALRQEGDEAGRAEVVISGTAGGEGVATEAKQDAQLERMPPLLDDPPLADTFAVPTRQVGSVDVIVVGAPAQSVAVGPTDSAIPVHTVLDVLEPRVPAALETDGEGGGGRFKISVGNRGLENAVENPVYVTLADGEVSNANSTAEPLGAGGQFVGEWLRVLGFANATINVFSDQQSAIDGLLIEWSSNGTDVDNTDEFTIPANKGKVFTFGPSAEYMRVSFTNGSTPQTVLRLQTILRRVAPKPSSHRLTVDLVDDDDAELVRAVLAARKPNGSYTNIHADADGNLVVTTPSQAADQAGFVAGRVVLATTTPTAVRSTIYTEQYTNGQRSIVSTNANDTAAGTGARAVLITYYDEDLAGPFEELVPTAGLTPVDTVATDICFIQEQKVPLDARGSANNNLGILSLKAATGGGGATIWSIAAGENQTHGAHHYVPPGFAANITDFAGGIKGADSTGYEIRMSNPLGANPAAQLVVSDLLRCPANAQAPMRIYQSAVNVPGPALLVGYALPDSTSSRTYYLSFSLYRSVI